MAITFDMGFLRQAGYDDLLDRRIEDVHEVGERDEYWIKAVRSTGKLILISKQTGDEIVSMTLEEATRFGLHPKQIDAAKRVFAL